MFVLGFSRSLVYGQILSYGI